MTFKRPALAVLLLLLLAACGDPSAPASETVLQGATRASIVASTDLAAFKGYQAGYAVVRNEAGITVTDLVGQEGSVSLAPGVRVIEFHDARMSFDDTGNAGKAYRVYQAAFNRRPDAGGLGYWIGMMEGGTTAVEVAAAFMQSNEFRAQYGSAPSNLTLVSKFYENVLQRKPDQAGRDFWVDLLDRKVVDSASVLAEFAESAENRKLLAPVIAQGMVYTPLAPRSYSADDRFAGTALDTCRWFDWSQQASELRQSDGLTLTTSADTKVSLPKLMSQYTVRDTFAIEASVTADARFLVPIPNGAQKYAGVGLYIDELNYALLSLAHEGGRLVIKPLVRRKGQFTNLPVVGTDASAVRLSIAASNGRLRFRFHDQRGWLDAGSTEEFAQEDYLVQLGATTIGVRQAFSATFSDFTVGGTHSYRPYVRGPLTARPDFMVGGAIESYVYGKLLGEDRWGNRDMLQALVDNGMGWLRTTVTTNSHSTLAATPITQWNSLPWDNNYWQSQEASGALIDMAGKRGMPTILSLFFSDKAANSGIADAPAAWRGLSLAETATRMREHTRSVAADYKARGYRIPIYEIGNEIENGFANFRVGERIARPPEGGAVQNLDYMRTQVWTPQAELLKAAIAGVREVDPNARIVLHVSSVGLTPGDSYIKAFYKHMVDLGVPFDIAGLSMPYSEGSWRLHEYTTDCWFGRVQETVSYLARLGKKSMISEASYPNSPRAQNGAPMGEFPFSEAGQGAWVREYLRFGNNNPDMVGFMYFYPDWYPGAADKPSVEAMESYGFFNADKSPRPSLREFKLPARH
jgi:arabinogalactan endo-1,4-beta-galactosidase